MDIYSFSLVLGGAGLGVMAIGGFGRHAGEAHGGGSHHGAGSHTTAGHAHQTHGHISTNARSLTDTFWSLASPMLLFSVLLGFGVTGLLLHRILSGVLLAGVAVAGAILFERLIISQLWKLLPKPVKTSPAAC